MRRVIRVAPAMRPPPVTSRTRPVPNAISEPEPVEGVVVAACTPDVGVLLEVELEEVLAAPVPAVTVLVVVAVTVPVAVVVFVFVVASVTVVGAVTVVVAV